MSRVKLRALGLLYVAIALLIVSGPAQAGYEMKRVAVAGVADQLTSSSYTMSVTSVPIAGATGVCPSGSVSSLGFWSIKGPIQVPVRLMLDKNESDALAVDLYWSGQSPVFEVYRSTSPVGLVSPDNLYRSTNSCEDTDNQAESSNLLFFKVIIPPSGE